MISFYVGIDPVRLNGVVYDGYVGPLVPSGNPYWVVGNVHIPVNRTLYVDNGSITYFEPSTSIKADGIFDVRSGQVGVCFKQFGNIVPG